jgi:hypothetical protein
MFLHGQQPQGTELFVESGCPVYLKLHRALGLAGHESFRIIAAALRLVSENYGEADNADIGGSG